MHIEVFDAHEIPNIYNNYTYLYAFFFWMQIVSDTKTKQKARDRHDSWISKSNTWTSGWTYQDDDKTQHKLHI